MSARRRTQNMPASRTKSSMDTNMRIPRHMTGPPPQAAYATYSTYTPEVSNAHYELVQGPTGLYPHMSACWNPVSDIFYPGSDSAHIPTLSVAPGDLTHYPLSDASLDSSSVFDTSSASSASTDSSSRSSISPPMTGAEMVQCVDVCVPEIERLPYSYSHYPDSSWQTIDGLPMASPLLPDHMELFESGKADSMMFDSLSSPVQECEYLGVSKLQFARSSGPKRLINDFKLTCSRVPARSSQHRPLRSASERSYTGPTSGSPEHYQSKEEHLEKTKMNPRNDPRYEAKPDKDGYYHCPFVRHGSCTHKPTKQKCYYAKNLDSHLKPYTCKYGDRDENCRSLRFSSNACLFRHEREMHGLHNHGMNPYLCMYRGCERARPENGFPRRWNQRDHMKRVHGWEEHDNNDEEVERAYPDVSRRRKGSGTSNSVAMKRTGSSRTQSGHMGHPATSSQQRNISTPRYLARAQEELQAHNMMLSGMTMDDVTFAPHQVMTQSPYPSGLYMQAAY